MSPIIELLKTPQATNIDEYIASCPAGIRTILEQVRIAVKEATPEAKRIDLLRHAHLYIKR